MPDPALESIEIEGFLSIRSATIGLGRLNVLIGANGAGKSNLIRAFEFLGYLADLELGLFVGRSGGASALLHDGSDHMRLAISGRHRYSVAFGPGPNDDLIFESEIIGRGTDGPREERISGSGGQRETALFVGRDADADAPVRQLLQGCRVFHFHDTSRNAPMKRLGPTADNLGLQGDARNVAAVLMSMRESATPATSSAYRRIVGAVRLVAPFFRDFVLEPEGDDRVRLRWRQVGSRTVFSANQLSDGTLRFVCLATLLHQPELPALVVLDEPELGLHPFAIVQLAGMLRRAANHSQVLLATQSVTLMTEFELGDLIVAERHHGASEFHRPDPARLAHWLADYSLGELWEKNLLGGRPSYEGSAADA